MSQLLSRRSKRNARKSPRPSLPELAASISRIGLLQNLVVFLAADGEQYEVERGLLGRKNFFSGQRTLTRCPWFADRMRSTRRRMRRSTNGNHYFPVERLAIDFTAFQDGVRFRDLVE